MNSPFAICHLPTKSAITARLGARKACCFVKYAEASRRWAVRMRALQTASASTQAVAISNGSCTKCYPTFTPKWGPYRFGPRSQRESLILSNGLIWISMISLDGRNLSESALGLGFCQRMLRLLQVRTKLSHTLCQLLHLAGPYGLCPGNWVIESLPSHMQALWTWKGKEDWIWNVPFRSSI